MKEEGRHSQKCVPDDLTPRDLNLRRFVVVLPRFEPTPLDLCHLLSALEECLARRVLPPTGITVLRWRPGPARRLERLRRPRRLTAVHVVVGIGNIHGPDSVEEVRGEVRGVRRLGVWWPEELRGWRNLSVTATPVTAGTTRSLPSW